MAEVRIITEFNEETIRQRLEFSMNDRVAPDLLHEKSVEIIHLQERGVKEALIALGWTPPASREPSAADEAYGPTIYTSDQLVVRVKERPADTTIYLHKKDEQGRECTPRGYMLGSNCIIWEKKKC